jgi:alpha-ribazole phosphatase
MTRLLLMRHGSTAWNAEGRYQGQTDTTLNEAGREQALRLAERLRWTAIDVVYASDLKRAWETAERIAAHHHLVVQPASGLREINFGEWEGKTHHEIEERDAAWLQRWFDDPVHLSPPGGETLEDVLHRVKTAYDGILERHPEGTVAVVAHGGTLRVLLCLALGVRPERYWQFRFDVASFSELSIQDEGAILNTLNDISHLRSQQRRRPPQPDGRCVDDAAGGKLILVLGGARSGKSDFAQRLIEEMAGGHRSRPSPVLFVATAEPGDEEMERRIEQHRRDRPDHWHTLEAPRNVGQAILGRAAEERFGAVLVDCMTLLTSNLLIEAEDAMADAVEAALMDEVRCLIGCVGELRAPMVVVSNEVGWGLVPPYPLGRAYRDLLGRANQALAETADEVILLIAGIPRVIKRSGQSEVRGRTSGSM